MARDITEGRSTRAIAVDLGVGTSSIWQNTSNSYDCAIAGIPFIAAINDQRPYERATAPFRKPQFDSQRDPGEQSLSTWWLRSQSSFHAGQGILFYDPLANPYSSTISTNSYRVKEAYGVDIWTQGQVTLLNDVNVGHVTTTNVNPSSSGSVNARGRVRQRLFTAKWNGNNGVILHDGYDLDRIKSDGTTEHWVDYIAGTSDPVFAATTDGSTMYWVTNDAVSGKLRMEKKEISAATTTSPTIMFTHPSGETVTNATIGYVKQRIVLGANNKIYEFPISQASMPSPIYTHPSTSYTFSSITESGTAIYISGYEGVKSSIFKYILDNTGAMPTLTGGPITAAELPIGEVVHRIFGYLGYIVIGTNKGIRVASVATDGSLTYGPLIVETDQPVYDFAARDRFVWCASGVNTEPGLIRIDLGTEIDTLRFAYAHDIHYDDYSGRTTTSVAFMGDTDKLAFCTAANLADTTITNKALTYNVATLTTSAAHNLSVGDVVWVSGVDSTFNTGSPYTGDTVLSVPTSTTFTFARTAGNVASTSVSSTSAIVSTVGHVYLEDESRMRASGYIETGLIRFNTLEPKNFKRVVGLGNFTYGSMTIQVRDTSGNLYDTISYDANIGSPEVTITQPQGAQDAIGLRFTIFRDATLTTSGAIFKGYQLKAVPATPRSRMISMPLMNYDTETDKYNATIGYEGRAAERLAALEQAEANGDVVTWQDFRNGEIKQCLIEEVKFTDITPPDKRLTNFGGIINLTIRTV